MPKSSDSAIPTLHTARSGAAYAQIGSTLLHSAYDPEREAERFVAAETGDEPPATLLIAGEALGYAARAAALRFPEARVIPLYYDPFFARRAERLDGWHPGSAEPIERFLERSLSELDVEGLRVIEWAPSARAYPECANRVRAAIAQCVRELNGSLMTTSALGGRWLRNSIVNLLTAGRALRLSPARGGFPVVVAASGPSLAESIPEIAALRDRLFLLALPSSVRALRAAALEPDLVVTTDGSYWASLHLAELGAWRDVPIAAALSGARIAGERGRPALLLSQGAPFETELLGALGVRVTEVAPNGTVAMTALELAARLTSGAIVFAGLDFEFRDIAEHVRPHTFDPLWARAATRLRPEYGAIALRAAQRLSPRAPSPAPAAPRSEPRATAGQPLSLATYAGWLARQAHSGGRLYRLRASSVAVPALPALGDLEFRALALSASEPPPRRLPADELELPPPSERRAGIARCIAQWIEELDGVRRRLALDAEAAPRLGERASSLLYLLDTKGCVESRRRARLQGAREGSASLLDAIDRARALLVELRERYLR